ncbi:hypothetical protein E2C01_029439 [Portunus trituberculatus]|uniref:Uncharacterized protein n=1 Tax=Portunus trituberculatus TaxID=210409 RepID=A0A5B7ERU5_PORTR|nr:hypothetical protein [Portunus trituberculatus]
MHLPHTHTHTLHLELKIKKKQVTPNKASESPTGKGTRNILLTTQNVLIPPSTFSSLTSATFTVLDLILNLQSGRRPRVGSNPTTYSLKNFAICRVV